MAALLVERWLQKSINWKIGGTLSVVEENGKRGHISRGGCDALNALKAMEDIRGKEEWQPPYMREVMGNEPAAPKKDDPK